MATMTDGSGDLLTGMLDIDKSYGKQYLVTLYELKMSEKLIINDSKDNILVVLLIKL